MEAAAADNQDALQAEAVSREAPAVQARTEATAINNRDEAEAVGRDPVQAEALGRDPDAPVQAKAVGRDPDAPVQVAGGSNRGASAAGARATVVARGNQMEKANGAGEADAEEDEEERDILIRLASDEVVGFARVPLRCSYQTLREQIVEDAIPRLHGARWSFLGPHSLALTTNQEKYKLKQGEVVVRVEETNTPMVEAIGEEDGVEVNTAFSSASNRLELASMLATSKERATWMKLFRRAEKKVKEMGRDDKFELISFDRDGEAHFRIFCHECGVTYGKGIADTCHNFIASHIMSGHHEANRDKRRNDDDQAASYVNESVLQPEPVLDSESIRRLVEEELEEVVSPFEAETQQKFPIYDLSVRGFKEKDSICIYCDLCGRVMQLFPDRGSLRNNLLQHVLGGRHQKAHKKQAGTVVAVGRPAKKPKTSLSQTKIQSFFQKSGNAATEGNTPAAASTASHRADTNEGESASTRNKDTISLDKFIARPSVSTTSRETKTSFWYKAGLAEEVFSTLAVTYKCKMQALGLPLGSVPCIIAEDETSIKKSIRWDARGDTLVGFCGTEGEMHQCDFSFSVTVGAGEEGCRGIQAFQGNRKAGLARVFIVNPLHVKLPKLVLGIQLTCNKFTSVDVREHWLHQQSLWSAHLFQVLGPLVGHASDGDSRRRKCQLEDLCSSTATRFKIAWLGWCLSGLNSSGSVTRLHYQDYIHNGKKLVNPLDSAVRRLYLGSELVTLNDLSKVYHSFHGRHGLSQQDIERKNRQNWRSAQRLVATRVQLCLAELRDPRSDRPEHTLGTETYVSVVANYIDIFLSPHKNLYDRAVLAAKVSFFFRLWRLWILEHERFSLPKNFISRETFLDVQISCHTTVLLIKYFRDYHQDIEVPLAHLGSDACENFFSKAGSMPGTERSYDGMDLLHGATGMNRMAEIEAQGLLRFQKAHKKQENIWEVLELVEGEPRSNLADYGVVQTDQLIIQALEEGFRAAQRLLLSVGIHSAAQWWEQPWQVEDWFNGQAVHALPITGQVDEVDDRVDEREETQREQDGEQAEAAEGEAAELEVRDIQSSELRHIFDEMINEAEDVERRTVSKVEPHVLMDGKAISKSTLVSQLNGNPWLSKDRLTRVKNRLIHQVPSRRIDAATALGIGSDCACWFEEDVPASCDPEDALAPRRGRPRKKHLQKKAPPKLRRVWYIGRVLSMRRKAGGSWREFTDPIDLDDIPSYAVELNLSYYKLCDEEVADDDGEPRGEPKDVTWWTYDLHACFAGVCHCSGKFKVFTRTGVLCIVKCG